MHSGIDLSRIRFSPETVIASFLFAAPEGRATRVSWAWHVHPKGFAKALTPRPRPRRQISVTGAAASRGGDFAGTLPRSHTGMNA
jgi:hypothetical protein